MALLNHVIAYLAVGVFAVAVIARFLFWSRMPMHLRWELYPVAHEAGRAHYGGSYLEEPHWWKKPRRISLLGELKVMLPEILFLVALKEHNLRLWLRSFPFHFGIYLVIASTGLMMGTGLLAHLTPQLLTGGLAGLLQNSIVVLGLGGLGLGLLGALGLLQRRLTDPALRDFTTAADIFNLLFFVVTFGIALTHGLLFDRDLTKSTAFVAGLVTFNSTAIADPLQPVTMFDATVILLALLVAYIPLTHMSHFVGKYFAYHAIRWNDGPNLRGSKQEETIRRLLNRPVSWSGPHIRGDGKKTWADLATEELKK